MKMSKKAKSMAAVLAVMALTAGSTMAADLTSTGQVNIGSIWDNYRDISVTASGEDVAASLEGQDLNVGKVTGTSFANAADTYSVDENGNIKGHSFTTDKNSVSNIGALR